jgi:hypothetical protein
MDFVNLAQKKGQMESSYDHGNELSGSTKCLDGVMDLSD